MAQKLAQRKFLLLKKQYLTEKLHTLDYENELLEPLENAIDSFLKNPGYCQLMTSNSFESNSSIEQWINESYNCNPHYPEQLSIPCPSGKKVRSKSESYIDMALFQKGIPYRYECELIIQGKTFYPDFTLLNPITGNLIYWEHFGIMDDSSYAKKAFNKMQLYHSNGIVPGKNLITTFETRENPFSYSDAVSALSMMRL